MKGCPSLARHPAIHDGDSCVTCGWRPDRRAEALLTKLSATEQMMADSRREIDYWKTRALKAEADLDAAESCVDPSCGAPCSECWKKGRGRHVHASSLPNIVDSLEDEVARLRSLLGEYADHARDSGWINLADEIRGRTNP